MTLNELEQLNNLRTALRTIEAQVSATQIALSSLKNKVDDVYFNACVEFNEDGGMSKEAAEILKHKGTPYSMKMSVPDSAYGAEGMGDVAATTMV